MTPMSAQSADTRNRFAAVMDLGHDPTMEFFCYHRDRPGSTPLRSQMVEQHWSYMDQFAATMIARGPTFTSDGTLTGSVHILELPGPAAARAFAFDEPGYQAGAYRDVLLRRWRNALGRTMWDFGDGQPDRQPLPRPRVHLGVGSGRPRPAAPRRSDRLWAARCPTTGPWSSEQQFSWRHLTQTRRDGVLSADRYTGIEVHQWRSGGRPN